MEISLKDLKEILLEKNEESKPTCNFKRDYGNGYYIVRTYSAGVFAGNIESRNGREVIMRNARRIWRWEGAASLSQLAEEGTSKPSQCKYPKEVDRVELLEVIEILDTTKKAETSIKAVAVWSE